MAGSRIYTVTQLNQEIKNLLESNPSFGNLFVRGEISNYKAHPSGHHYMTIKDEGAAIQAVLFRTDAARLRFRLSNGLRVVARGRVSSFPKTGQVQLYLADLMPEGDINYALILLPHSFSPLTIRNTAIVTAEINGLIIERHIL